MLAILVGAWSQVGAAERAVAAVEDERGFYLWLGLGCFTIAVLLMAARRYARTVLRRQRLRGMRMIAAPGVPATIRFAPGKLARLWKWGRRPVPLRWEERARAAELKVDQAVAVLRQELTPHLAAMMKDRLVCALLSQRAKLLAAHTASAGRVAALEQRLSSIQRQLHKQAEAYEHRITELERDLEAKDRLTRELLKVKIKLTRQALEAVRIQSAPEF